MPTLPVAGAGERLLVERRGDVAVRLPAHRVVVAAALVPEAVVVVVHGDGRRSTMSSATCCEIVGEAGADAARHESRDRRAELRDFVRPDRAAPPERIEPAAGDDLAVGDEPAVFDLERLGG